ncbi:hypothetical protein [Streptomyces sp. MAI_2237]
MSGGRPEAEESRRELAQAQSDWIADRIRSDAELLALKGEAQRHRDERQELLEQIARLRAELKDTVEQKREAEHRCTQLEAQAIAIEIDVAERRERDGVDGVDVPIGFVQAKLQTAEDAEIYRELAEFALSRSSVDVAQLSIWLFGQGMEEPANQLVSDYCRQRPILNIVDLVLNYEVLGPARTLSYMGVTGQVYKVVGRRSCEDLLQFCTLYAEARQHSKTNRIKLADITYRWFGHHRSFPERVGRFFDVVDHLISIGEQGASADLVRQTVTLTGISSVFGPVIAESGRDAEVRILVTEFLQSVKRSDKLQPHMLLRQIQKADRYSNPLMAELLLAGMCDMFELAEFCSILIESLDLRWETSIAGRIVDAIIAKGLAAEVRSYMVREFAAGYIEVGEVAEIEYSPVVDRLLNMLSGEER